MGSAQPDGRGYGSARLQLLNRRLSRKVASGSGHFPGLMPEAMLRGSTVIGIESDGLYACIAQALHPDMNERHQPFEAAELPRSEQRITALDADLSARVDTRGDRFRLDLGADTLTDRGLAGELLLRTAERLHGSRQERRLGRFAGFDLWAADLFTGEVVLQLRGAAVHTARLQPTALGTTRALEHVVNHLEDALAASTATLAQARKRLDDLEAQAAQPFPYADRLAALQQRQQELAAALDLTRPQAGPAEADLPEPPPPPPSDDNAAQDGDWNW